MTTEELVNSLHSIFAASLRGLRRKYPVTFTYTKHLADLLASPSLEKEAGIELRSLKKFLACTPVELETAVFASGAWTINMSIVRKHLDDEEWTAFEKALRALGSSIEEDRGTSIVEDLSQELQKKFGFMIEKNMSMSDILNNAENMSDVSAIVQRYLADNNYSNDDMIDALIETGDKVKGMELSESQREMFDKVIALVHDIKSGKTIDMSTVYALL